MSQKVCLVIAQKGFRDEELIEPRDIFLGEGYEVAIASPKKGICEGNLGAKIESTIPISDIDADSLDAIVVVGGPGSLTLLESSELKEKLTLMSESGKVVTAICLAPMILAKFGLLEEKDATVFPTEESLQAFSEHKVQRVNEDVVVDGKFVTANGPHAATAFAHMVVDVLHGLL